MKVTGVKLGNVKTKGTFTFPSIANSAASWTLSDVAEDLVEVLPAYDHSEITALAAATIAQDLMYLMYNKD